MHHVRLNGRGTHLLGKPPQLHHVTKRTVKLYKNTPHSTVAPSILNNKSEYALTNTQLSTILCVERHASLNTLNQHTTQRSRTGYDRLRRCRTGCTSHYVLYESKGQSEYYRHAPYLRSNEVSTLPVSSWSTSNVRSVRTGSTPTLQALN